GLENQRQLLRQTPVENCIRPPLAAHFARGICEHIGGRNAVKISPKAQQMRRRGFGSAAFIAKNANYFHCPALGACRSRTCSMICWAETTRPCSRVRSAAASV